MADATKRRSDLSLQQLGASHRVALVGELTGAVAHHAATPLNVILGRAQLIGRGVVPADKLSRSAASIEKEARALADDLQRLVSFARAEDSSSDLRALAERVVAVFTPLSHRGRLTCRVDGGRTRPIERPGSVELILAALLSNAISAARSSIVVLINEQGCTISDDGPGVADIPAALEWFRSDWAPQRAGLGLPVADGLASLLGGSLSFASSSDGLTAKLILP